MPAKTLLRFVVLSSILLATACVSADPGSETNPEHKRVKYADPLDVHERRIATVLEELPTRRGTLLLRDLQWLIQQKGLSVPHIVETLEAADERTRANLLYALGFISTQESIDTLVSHLQDPSEPVRYEAAAGLLQHGDPGAIPTLLGFLESENKQMRFKAFEALRTRTGKEFGYRFEAPPIEREESLVRWRGWWDKRRERLMMAN